MKMNKKLLITAIIFLFTISSFSQIEMGKIEKVKEVEKKIEFPIYNDSENFVEYSEFYESRIRKIIDSGSGKNPFETKCDKNDYYKRYYGLKIFYPAYSDDYRKDEKTFFKNTDKIENLNWSHIGNKYFTIISINPKIESSELFNKLKNNYGKDFYGDILFELKDDSNNEIVYAIESSYSQKFILVPYFEKIKEYTKSNKFIAITDFGGDKVPLRKTNGTIDVLKNTEWNGELTLLRRKDLRIDSDEKLQSDEDIRYMVLLSKKNDTIIIPLNKKDNDKGQWCFEELFIAKNNFEKQNLQNINNEKLKESDLIKKYGEKYAKLVSQKKLTIGMSKDMCSDICGITLNRKKIKNASGEIEIWEYIGILKLYFKNGKLSQIVNY
jgi:hypothetical protein